MIIRRRHFPWLQIYWRALLATIVWRAAHAAAWLALTWGLAYYLAGHFRV